MSTDIEKLLPLIRAVNVTNEKVIVAREKAADPLTILRLAEGEAKKAVEALIEATKDLRVAPDLDASK